MIKDKNNNYSNLLMYAFEIIQLAEFCHADTFASLSTGCGGISGSDGLKTIQQPEILRCAQNDKTLRNGF
jgi:hypothetical protein